LYLDNVSLNDNSPCGANIIEANDDAAAGCLVVSIMREKTLSTFIE
jgi:hypothetical protein